LQFNWKKKNYMVNFDFSHAFRASVSISRNLGQRIEHIINK
jgi:hypothetical protein